MESINNLYNELLPALGLNVEANKSITFNKNGEKKLVTCNDKPVLVESNTDSEYNYILLNIFAENQNCTYSVLEKYMYSIFSSKMNILFTNLLKSAMGNELSLNSEKEIHPLVAKLYKIDFNIKNIINDNILEKWSKLFNVIKEQQAYDVLIKFDLKEDFICVEKPAEFDNRRHNIMEDDRVDYISAQPFINLRFPLYELLKKNNTKKFLGIELEDNDIDVFKVLFEYVFEDIEKEQFYRFPKMNLWKKLPNEVNKRVFVVESTPMGHSLMLVKLFINLSNQFDSLLKEFAYVDRLQMENAMFNLTFSENDLDRLKEENPYIVDYEDKFDFQKLKKSSQYNEINSLNEKLNNDDIQECKIKDISKSKKNNRFKYKSIKKSSFSYSKLMEETNSLDNYSNLVLDPMNESFCTIIPLKERLRHSYVLGNSGAGKSSMLESLIYFDIQDTNSSKIIFDITGKTTKRIVQFIKNKDDLVLIDGDSESSLNPIINPFELVDKEDEKSNEFRTKGIINAFRISLGIEWSANMEAVLFPCISVLLRKGNSDIFELQRFMDDDNNSDLIELGKKSPVKGHRKFFKTQFKKEKLDVTKDAISTKLQVLLNDGSFSKLVTGKSTINLEKVINTKSKVIIFKIPKEQNLFSRLIMEMIQGIIRMRRYISDENKVPTHLYLDEFQNYLTPTVEEILSESRNYNLYATLAHQFLDQLDKKMTGMVLSCTNIKIVGSNSYDNLKKMSKELQVDVKELENLEQGEFFLKVGSKETIKIKNTDRFLDKNISEEEWDEHIQYQTEKYCQELKDELEELETTLIIDSKPLTPIVSDF